jgi:CubicO group peptidase (beta-lactamase class C family)
MTRRKALLACGLLSSLLYVGTDVLTAIRHGGYHSFTAQTISELSARGAPTKPLVDPLLVLYGLLALGFGVGVWGSAGGNRELRLTAGLLIGFAVVGLPGPWLFAMNLRGSGDLGGDLPHIVLTGVLVLFIIAAVAAGAFAQGRRFRRYSLATLATILVFGVLVGLEAPAIAAGEPTPWIGVAERACIGAFLLWVAVLAVSLLRADRGTAAAPWRSGRVTSAGGYVRSHGKVAKGFEEVRAEFERNFAERGEIGAAVSAYWRGEKVVDLWGGRRSPESDEPWEEDTMAVVCSTTKGVSAMTLAVAHARGWLDYDVPVSRYWPEFAQNGKEGITVRQLLAHEAGLVWLDEDLSIERLGDLDGVARVLARQRPAWPPGTRHGYHAMTVGLYMQELFRRVDPAHRTLGRFFREEIAGPLGLDLFIGLPPEVPDRRLATLLQFSTRRALRALRHTPPAMLLRVLWPWSLLRKSMSALSDVDWNDRRSLEVEVPAGNGVGTARAIARLYSAFAEGGAELGVGPETMARLTAPPNAGLPRDVVMGEPACYSLGFLRPGPDALFGSSPRAFGTPGAGGSFGFADPDARLGYAYVMNKMDFHMFDDPREKALRGAVHRAIATLGGRDAGKRAAA